MSKQSPKNVTATALTKDQTNACWYVYIAKNNGLSQEDRDCAQWLDEWLGLKRTEHREHNGNNKYWKILLAYWKDRTDYYLRKAQRAKSKTEKLSKDDIRGFCQDVDKDFDMDKFNEEWEEVMVILRSIGNETLRDGNIYDDSNRGDDKDSDDSVLMRYYNFWGRSSRQNYLQSRLRQSREKEISALEKSVVDYQLCVYYLEMLGMPISIWESIVRFRDIKAKIVINIVILERLPEATLKTNQIRTLLTDWKSRGLDTNKALKTLSESRTGQKVYLHCELQILLLFHQIRTNSNLIKHKFIGCSKLSCHLCWEILKDRDFKTRGSHGKISAKCVFPLPFELDGIIKTLKRLHHEWKVLFDQHKDGKFPVWPRQIDTDPARTEINNLDKVSYGRPLTVYLLITYLKAIAKKRLDKLGCQGYDSHQFPYQILNNVNPGRGSFADVYAANRGRSSRAYALKRMKIDSPEKLNLIEKEINNLREVKHQNILVLHEAFYEKTDPRIVYLATSPWAPETLHVAFWKLRKKNHDLWWSQLGSDPRLFGPWQSIIQQCLDGLTYLHSRGIIHKDLKPHNILLFPTTDQPAGICPIIADFGISKNIAANCGTDGLGTYEFKAPEQTRSTRGPTGQRSDQRSDIWSLGCCFAFIAVLLRCGIPKLKEFWGKTMDSTELRQRGFYNDNNRKRLKDVLELDENSFSHPTDSGLVYSVQLGRLVKKILVKNPEHRILAADALYTLKQLDARLQVLELPLPPMNICIRLGSNTVVRGIAHLDIAPTRELINRCYAYFEEEASIHGYPNSPSDIRLIYFKHANYLMPPGRNIFQSEAFDLTSKDVGKIHGRTFYSGHDWTSSLPIFKLLALRKNLFTTLAENIDSTTHCGLEIQSQRTSLCSGSLPHNFGNMSPEISNLVVQERRGKQGNETEGSNPSIRIGAAESST